jgi:23S rRNA pseudouridine1911/1915/1917 synthase
MGLIQNATRNKIQNAATEGNILLNDVIVKSNYKVKAFDVVRVMLTSSLRIILLLRIFR